MKFSHRDFRPHRRSRFVGRPPHRRPTFRILFLGILGVIVYLKFDSVAKYVQGFQLGRWWASLRDSPTAASTLPLAQSWSADSQSVSIACPTLPDSCLGSGFPLGPDAAGKARATLAKAASQMDGDASLGFRAGFRKREGGLAGAAAWELDRLEMQGTSGSLALARADGIPGAPLCAGTRCLDAFHPQAPLAAFSQAVLSADPEGMARGSVSHARFLPGRALAVRPVLRGRVVSIPPQGDSVAWLKLHHGRDLYSQYRGFARLSGTVLAGAMVEPGDTLGWLPPREDSLASLDLRVESRGASLDVLGFLGIADTSAEAAHAR